MRKCAPFALTLLFFLSAVTGPTVPADDDTPHAGLIGKVAADIPTDFALNGPSVKLADLKGKVVLVDFWAVWCRPCIAAFPHLARWHSEYKAKGLEVVGVTTYFEKFGFDAETGKAFQYDEGKMTPAQEQAMLRDFVKHHELPYRVLAVPRSHYRRVFGTGYRVNGVPQAVLIDRKGMVRQVVVGSDEEKTAALERGIRELLSEK